MYAYLMQFDNQNDNPYDVLGVPDGASIAVCRATFRSLVKIYHPDVFGGEKSFAEKRMKELNAAHDFLSNPENKKKFDDCSSKNSKGAQSNFDENDLRKNEFETILNALSKNWAFACEFHPQLIVHYNKLRKLHIEPACVYVVSLLENKNFGQAELVARELEQNFLSSKFSSDPEIMMIAGLAISEGRIKFAKKLNQAIKILGPNSKKQILTKLFNEDIEFGNLVATTFNMPEHSRMGQAFLKMKEGITEIGNACRSGNIQLLNQALSDVGYTIQWIDKQKQRLKITNPDGKETFISGFYALSTYASKVTTAYYRKSNKWDV